jgi:transcriptional regulator with XRE-family HTH domain
VDGNGAKDRNVCTILDGMPRISGDRLRKVRDERLLSQRELAERAGLSPTTILKLETARVDEPHPRTIRKLADALEVDPDELLRGEGIRPSVTKSDEEGTQKITTLRILPSLIIS